MIKVTLLIITLLIQTSFSTLLTLKQAEGYALKNNLELQKEEMSKKAVMWEKWNAIAMYLPKFSLQTMHLTLDEKTVERANAYSNSGSEDQSNRKDIFIDTYSNIAGDTSTGIKSLGAILGEFMASVSPSVDIPRTYKNSWETSFNVDQKISNGFKELIAIFQMAPSKIKLIYGSYDLTKEMIIINTRKIYYSLIRSKEAVNLFKTVLDVSQRTYNKTNIQYTAGEISKDIFLAKEAQLESDRAEYIGMKNILNMSQYMLFDIIGKSISGELLLDPLSVFETKLNKAKLKDGSVNNSSELKIATGVLGMARAGKNITLTNALPNFNLRYSRKWLADTTLSPMDSDPSYSIAFIMNWSLGIDNFTSSQMARYETKKAELDLKIKTRDLKTKKKIAFESLATLKDKVSATKKASKAQNRSYEIMTVRYENGLVSTIDFINYSLLYKQKRITYIESLFNYLEEMDEYNRLIGKLEVENGK